MPANTGGNDGQGNPGAQGNPGGNSSGQGSGQGGNAGAPWVDAFPEVKANADLAGYLGTQYKSPAEALLALDSGFGPRFREKYAGDDKQRLAELQRYPDTKTLLDSFFEAKGRIRAGEVAKPLPPNPNAQEIQAYRELQGIPAEPKGYLEKLPDGLVIGEADREGFESLAGALHEANTPPRAVAAVVKWWNERQATEAQQSQELDAQERTEAEDALRKAWGPEFKINQNVMKSYMAGLDPEARDALEHARGQDGRGIMNNPAVVQALIGLIREAQDISTILDAGGGDAPLNTVQSEIDQIEKLMRDDRPAYNKDKAKQDRLLQLYTARDKIKAVSQRGRAA